MKFKKMSLYDQNKGLIFGDRILHFVEMHEMCRDVHDQSDWGGVGLVSPSSTLESLIGISDCGISDCKISDWNR